MLKMKQLKELGQRIARELDPERIIVFGSHARGEGARLPGSDIDVLVVLSGQVRAGEEISRTSGFVAELSRRHDVVVSCVFMDEGRFRRRSGPLLRNIRKEGIAL